MTAFMSKHNLFTDKTFENFTPDFSVKQRAICINPPALPGTPFTPQHQDGSYMTAKVHAQYKMSKMEELRALAAAQSSSSTVNNNNNFSMNRTQYHFQNLPYPSDHGGHAHSFSSQQQPQSPLPKIMLADHDYPMYVPPPPLPPPPPPASLFSSGLPVINPPGELAFKLNHLLKEAQDSSLNNFTKKTVRRGTGGPKARNEKNKNQRTSGIPGALKNCETCKKLHDGTFASGRFCSSRCARTVGGLKLRQKCMEIRKQKNRRMQLEAQHADCSASETGSQENSFTSSHAAQTNSGNIKRISIFNLLN